MAAYTRAEAREWAREKLVGAVNCTIPSFTTDLRAHQREGHSPRHPPRQGARIHRHPRRLARSASRSPEYLDFLRIVQGRGRRRTSTSSTTRAGTTSSRTSRRSAAPRRPAPTSCCCPTRRTSTRSPSRRSTTTPRPSATPRTSAIILFPMTIWGFSSRIHPSDIPTRLIRRLLDDMPQHRRDQGRGRLPEHPERHRVPPPLRRRGGHLGADRGRPDPAVAGDADPALGDQRPRVLRAR